MANVHIPYSLPPAFLLISAEPPIFPQLTAAGFAMDGCTAGVACADGEVPGFVMGTPGEDGCVQPAIRTAMILPITILKRVFVMWITLIFGESDKKDVIFTG